MVVVVTYDEIARGTVERCIEATAWVAWGDFSRFMFRTLLTGQDRDVKLFSMWNPVKARWALGLQLENSPVLALTPEDGDEFLNFLCQAQSGLKSESERETVTVIAQHLTELMADIRANDRGGRTYDNPLPSMCMPAGHA
jgi:hypothetical protein